MTNKNPLTKLTKKHPKNPKQTTTHTTNTTNINNTQWMQKAACKNQTHHMFPQHHKDITYIQTAKQICQTCPVQTQCLNYALQHPPADMHGVWAGHTPRQLAAKQKQLGIKPTKPTIAQMWNQN
jgi:WhiB family redox-sensing transcriptional regulator